MSAVRSKSAIVVKEEAQSRPARGGQVLACEEVEQVLLLECNIFQVSGTCPASGQSLISSPPPWCHSSPSSPIISALVKKRFWEKKNLISQVAVYLSEEGLHPMVEVVRFFPSSQGCHANLVPGMFKI